MGIEIERKFLVTDTAFLSGEPECIRLVQGYLSTDPDRTVRVRLVGDNGFITVKGKTRGAVRLEYEYPIPGEDARELLQGLCSGPLVEKQRFTVHHQGSEWSVDIFEGRNQGLAVAEIELDSETQSFEKPPWAGREVTHDPRYYNACLSMRPIDTWGTRDPLT